MIFKPRLVEAILIGRKTMTRRSVKPEVPCRYRVGRTYALQAGRGKPGCAWRLRILKVDLELLRDITLRGTRAEGFESRKAFFDYWRLLHGEVDKSQWVWAIRFAVVGPPYHPSCPSDLGVDDAHGLAS